MQKEGKYETGTGSRVGTIYKEEQARGSANCIERPLPSLASKILLARVGGVAGKQVVFGRYMESVRGGHVTVEGVEMMVKM